MPVVFVILFIVAASLAISALFVSVFDVHIVTVSQFDAPLRRSSSSLHVDAAARLKLRIQRRRRAQREGTRQLLHVDDDDGEEILDEAEFIVAKAYAETYGRMTQCNTDVVGKDCIANVVEEMDRVRRRLLQNENVTFAAAVDEENNNDDNDGAGQRTSDPATYSHYIVPPDHPYPWWFATLLRDMPTNGVFGPWHELTNANLAAATMNTDDTTPPPNGGIGGLKFCSIGKNGCTEWRGIFKALNAPEYCNHSNDTEWKNSGRSNRYCKESKLHTNVKLDDDTIDSMPRTVFLRDPLERLLSGYLDKCVKPNIRKSQGHCEPNVVFGMDHLQLKTKSPATDNKGHSISDMTLVVNELEREMFATYVDLMPLKWNVHFVPQAFTCDLYRTIDTYDFVGIMGKTFMSELNRMATRYGGILPNVLDDAFHYRTKLANETLLATTTTNVGADNAHGTKAPSKVYRYYSPRSIRRALEYLSIDYVMLGFDVPDWAKEILRNDK
jgi:hypothetical protein